MKLARNERGFTLIELMVVLIIIGILAAIAIPIMSKQTDKAKNKRALSEVKGMKTAIDIFVNDPSVNTAGLKSPRAVTTTNAGDIIEVLTTAGVNCNIDDPWGTAYHYIAPAAGGTSGYTILSYGTGKALGGGDDITAKNDQVPMENQTAAVSAVDPITVDVALH